MLERALTAGGTLGVGEEQQPVGIERVPDMRSLAEREALGSAALDDTRSILGELLGLHAVLAAHGFGCVRALGRHGRIELERLHVQFDVAQVVSDARQRTLKRIQADRAPGAGDVGYEVDSHR
jgi:hypothetical protein